MMAHSVIRPSRAVFSVRMIHHCTCTLDKANSSGINSFCERLLPLFFYSASFRSFDNAACEWLHGGCWLCWSYRQTTSCVSTRNRKCSERLVICFWSINRLIQSLGASFKVTRRRLDLGKLEPYALNRCMSGAYRSGEIRKLWASLDHSTF